MNAAVGFVTAGVQYGLDSILIKPKRSIGPFTAQVTIEESHHDELEITSHPIEQGATIADHAYKRPAELTIRCAWSNSPVTSGLFTGISAGLQATVSGVQSIVTGNTAGQVREIYQKLLELQNKRIPFEVFTGKRSYANMLMKSLSVTTDKESENSLIVTATFYQLIIVSTQLVAIATAPENQADAPSTQPVADQGSKQLVPSTQFVDDGH